MSVGDWPDEPDTDPHYVVDPVRWAELVDRTSEPQNPVSFGVAAAQDRSSAAICVAGLRSDGLVHVEVVDQRKGVAWVVDRMVQLDQRQAPCAVVVDPGGAAGSLITPLEQAGVSVQKVTAREYAQACGRFFVAATERSEEQPTGGLRHQNDVRLNMALESAQTRPLSESWAWDSKAGTTDISPLAAVTLAMRGLDVFLAAPSIGGWMVGL
jgi:hypothetical protein